MKGLNIYCDESMHLMAQSGPVAWGALAVPRVKAREFSRQISDLKKEFSISPTNELKWVNVRKSKLEAYKRLLDIFFDNDALRARMVVVRDKSMLDHERFDQTHDEWYYKMYFQLLNLMIPSDRETRIFLDVKDTLGSERVKKLHHILCLKEFDFNHDLIKYIQEIKSHEVALMSIVDILIGALTYHIRGLRTSPAKLALIDYIQKKSGRSLDRSTFLSEKKLNLFYWGPKI